MRSAIDPGANRGPILLEFGPINDLLPFVTGRRWCRSLAKVTKQVKIEKLKLFFVTPKTISVVPYPYNILVSYPLSLKLFCQLSLIPKTPNRASSVNGTWINTRFNKNWIHKVPSSNCNHRLVYLRQWHIQIEIDITIPYLFLTISMQLLVDILFWHFSDLLDRVCRLWSVLDRPRGWFCMTNQILYRIILFSAVECFWIQINHWTAK